MEKIMTKKYKYLVAYIHSNGLGRITMGTDTEECNVGTEELNGWGKYIESEYGKRDVGVMSFQKISNA